MNKATEKLIREIFKCEFRIMFPSGPIEVSHAILHRDNCEKAIIDIHGEDKYKEFRKELSCKK